jgi:uncharacterized membrane protein YqgA involved in biofilm formation
MTGTFINVAAVVAGTLIGRAIGDRLPARVRETLMHVVGLITLVIGMDLALKTKQPLVLLGSLTLGGLLGEVLHIENGIERLGRWAESSLSRPNSGEKQGDFAHAFVSTSLIFCVGPMTLLGCIQDGLRGDYSLLATKSMLDGIGAMAFASVYGWGVLLSAVTVLIVQGALTLSAGALSPLQNDAALQTELFAAGGVMLLGLGLRLLELKPIRVANLLPALALAPLIVLLIRGLS